MSDDAAPTPFVPGQVFEGGMMVSDPVQTTEEPLPLAVVDAGLHVVGEGNDDAASVGLGAAGSWAVSGEKESDDGHVQG